MRKALTILTTLAGAAACASMAHAGDLAQTAQSEQASKAHAGGGCGGYSMVVVEAADENSETQQAVTKAKVQALIDSALKTEETAAAPQTAAPKNGS